MSACFSGVQTPHRLEGAEKRCREKQTQRRAAEPQHDHVWGSSTSLFYLTSLTLCHIRSKNTPTISSALRHWSTCRRRRAADKVLRSSKISSPLWCLTNSPSQFGAYRSFLSITFIFLRCILSCTLVKTPFYVIVLSHQQGRKTTTVEPPTTNCSGNSTSKFFSLLSLTWHRVSLKLVG